MLNFGFLKKIKKDNKGMSLVEVLVGIGILSVSMAPLLMMFVFSTKYNAKAKVKQRATNAAMSVMETFKAYDLETSKKHFDDGNFIKGNSATYSISYNGGGTDIDNATYTITGMTFNDDATSKKYNVKCEVTPGTSESINITPLYNKDKDVLFAEDKTVSKYYDPYEVIDYLFGAGNHFAIPGDEITEVTVTRNVYVYVEANGKVNIEYRYIGTFDRNAVTHSFKVSASGVSIDTVNYPLDPIKNAVISTSADLGMTADGYGNYPLRDIYLYYNPVYKDRASIAGATFSVKTEKDNFWFNNSYSSPVKVYTFRQRRTGDYSLSGLTIKENDYHITPHRYGTWTNDMDVFDMINVNLGDMTTVRSTMFDPVVNNGGGGSGNLVTHSGMTDTDTVPLTANIKITVIDPSPKPGEKAELAVINGTILR